MEAKIQKWGDSQGIRIPKHVMDALELSEGDAVHLDIVQGRLLVEKSQKHVCALDQLFEGYKGNDQPAEYEWGKPRGSEFW